MTTNSTVLPFFGHRVYGAVRCFALVHISS